MRWPRDLTGAIPSGTSVLRLELVSFQGEVVNLMIEAFSPERGLYFLTSKRLDARRDGESPAVQASEEPCYRLAVADGILRDPVPDRSLFAELDGTRFDEPVRAVVMALRIARIDNELSLSLGEPLPSHRRHSGGGE